MWGITNVDVVRVVVGTLGSVTKKLGKWIEKLGIRVRIGLLQKTTLLGMARIFDFQLSGECPLGILGYLL